MIVERWFMGILWLGLNENLGRCVTVSCFFNGIFLECFSKADVYSVKKKKVCIAL